MSWPSYAEILAPGFRPGQDEDVERTPFDDGLVRQEKRYRAALGTLEVTALVAADDLDRFRTWARERAHRWFDIPTPLAEGTVSVRVRDGGGGIGYRLHREAPGRVIWAATMTLEGTDL